MEVGIVLSVVVAMKRDIQNRRIFVENVLHPVSMVNIPVKYQNLADVWVLFLGMLGSDGYSVEETEAPSIIHFGVMSGRTY